MSDAIELRKLKESLPNMENLRIRIRYLVLVFADDALKSPPAPVYRVVWEHQRLWWILTNMSTREKRLLDPSDLERYIMALSIVPQGR